MQVLGAGGALGGPARPGGNFGGKTPNLGAAPHDWGFAKNVLSTFWLVCLEVAISLRVMRPTSSDARLGGWMLSYEPLYFAFSKGMLKRLSG